MRHFLVFVISTNQLPVQVGVLKLSHPTFPSEATIQNHLQQQNFNGSVTGITEVTQAELTAY